MAGLVVDVRQNPGGILNGALEISNLFVEKGKNILQSKKKVKMLKFIKQLTDVKLKYPFQF